MMKRSNIGFTLIELMVVLAIVGILSAVALPSYSEQIKRDRLVSNVNQLHSVFKFARAEAVKRDSEIVLEVSGMKWLVKLDQEILAQFIPTHTSIGSELINITVSATGMMTWVDPVIPGEAAEPHKFIITDGDSDIRLCIFVSGQSFTTSEANC